MSTPRCCIIDAAKGPVTVKIVLSDSLIAGCDFMLADAHGGTIEQWKLTAEANNINRYTIRQNNLALFKDSHLSWQMVYCSMNPKTIEGTVEIFLFQGNEVCKITVPAKWQLTNLPPCKLNTPKSFNDSLLFVVKH
ncbi:MAG: hypothetical protein HW421_3165 [Ignavibacteria bacterium]|nr:hypothetical protein [Ignavibacteria bacterium]